MLDLLAGGGVFDRRGLAWSGLDPNRRDGGRCKTKLRQPDAGLSGFGLPQLRAHAESEAVLRPQGPAALHRQSVRHCGARGEAELDDDLPEGPFRAVLHLEYGRELLGRDQPELGHELADLALRRIFRVGGRAHDC